MKITIELERWLAAELFDSMELSPWEKGFSAVLGIGFVSLVIYMMVCMFGSPVAHPSERPRSFALEVMYAVRLLQWICTAAVFVGIVWTVLCLRKQKSFLASSPELLRVLFAARNLGLIVFGACCIKPAAATDS